MTEGYVEYWIVSNETNTDVHMYTRGIYSRQERIPVGCAPSAAVAVSGGEVSTWGGSALGVSV